MKRQHNADTLLLDEIKTGFMGYDKEAVLEYILLLLKKAEKDKDEELRPLSDKIADLETENKKLQGQVDIYKENYEMLNRQLDEMTKAWDQNVKYAAQRDALLRNYQQKEASIEKNLREAEQKAKSIMEDAARSKSCMMEQANNECEELLRQAQEKVAMCKLDLAKIVCKIIPIIKDDIPGEEASLANVERKPTYGEDHL